MHLKHILTFAIVLSGFAINAQTRIGYINSDVIYTSHPQYTAAMGKIEQLEAELTNRLELLQKDLQKEVNLYEEMKENSAPAEELEEQENKAIMKQQEFDNLLKQSQEDLDNFRSTTLQPLLDEIDTALISSAKNIGLDAVFQDENNEGVSFLLYAPEGASLNVDILKSIKSTVNTDDLTPLSFKAKKVRIGYTSLETVLLSMNEYKNMESTVELYEDQLMRAYNVKKNGVTELISSYNSEENPEKKKSLLEEISKANEEIAKMESEFEEKVANKKSSLLEPILEKLEEAINKVAEKNKLTYVLNQTNSSGVSTILFGPESSNISLLLFEELGIENVTQRKTDFKADINQKIGYVNVELIMSAMPEVSTIILQLKTYQTKLIESSQRMGKDPYQDQKTSQEISNKVLEKRSALLNPIMTKIQAAIDQLAANENCDYILNQTGGNIVWVNTEFDLNEKLAALLDLM